MDDDEERFSEEEAAEAYREWFWMSAQQEQENQREFMRVCADMRRKELKENAA